LEIGGDLVGDVSCTVVLLTRSSESEFSAGGITGVGSRDLFSEPFQEDRSEDT
jgi:hypothetical protein